MNTCWLCNYFSKNKGTFRQKIEGNGEVYKNR